MRVGLLNCRPLCHVFGEENNLPSVQKSIEILDTVAHCHGEREAGAEANSDSGHQCSWHRSLGICDLFCKMQDGIDARIHKTRSGQTSDECDAIRPSRAIFKVRPDVRGGLFFSDGEACYRYNQKARDGQYH